MGSDHTPIFTKLHQYPAKEVAVELTLIDAELLRRIQPEELQDAAWTKKATKVRRGKEKKEMPRGVVFGTAKIIFH